MPGFFVLFLIFFVVVAVFAIRQGQRADETWRQVAARLSLDTRGGGMMSRRSLGGLFEGFPVRVFTYTRSAGKSTTTYTAYEVSYPSLRLGLRLKRQGFLSGVAAFFGREDHLIGHPVFDESVVIQGNRASDLREFLTAERRTRLLGAFRRFPGLVVTDTSVRADLVGLETDPEQMEERLRALTDLARVLTTDEESALGRALEARRDGRLGDALDHVRGIPGDLDARFAEGEMLLASGRPEQAAEAFDAVRERSPEDGEAAGLAREARRLMATPRLVGDSVLVPAPPPVPGEEPDLSRDALSWFPGAPVGGEPAEGPARGAVEEDGAASDSVPAPEEEAPAASSKTLGSGPEGEPAPAPGEEPPAAMAEVPAPGEVATEEIADALFASSMTSYEAARVFEERFAGKRVLWSGELQRVETFVHDTIFEGGGPGCRALVRVHEMTHDGYGGREVQAVVRLPRDAEEELRARRGERIEFAGVLVRCDAFMRNLFVAEGRLVRT